MSCVTTTLHCLSDVKDYKAFEKLMKKCLCFKLESIHLDSKVCKETRSSQNNPIKWLKARILPGKVGFHVEKN